MRVGDNAHYAEGSILNSRKRGRGGGNRRKEGRESKGMGRYGVRFMEEKSECEAVYCVPVGCFNAAKCFISNIGRIRIRI